MSAEPWFKFWAADYLTDSNVAKVPPEGRELLIRMWCLCNVRGGAPSDLEDLSLATGLRMSYVSEWLPYLLSKNPSQKSSQILSKPFFDLRDGIYYSRRMERDKAKSDRARENAQCRLKKTSSAKGLANGSAGSPAQISDSDIRDQRAETKKERNKEQPLAPSATNQRSPLVFELPLWIDKEAWDAFVEMRKKTRKPLTERARDLIIGRLEKFRADGIDVTDALNRSVLSSWADVYPPKDQTRGTGAISDEEWLRQHEQRKEARE